MFYQFHAALLFPSARIDKEVSGGKHIVALRMRMTILNLLKNQEGLSVWGKPVSKKKTISSSLRALDFNECVGKLVSKRSYQENRFSFFRHLVPQ